MDFTPVSHSDVSPLEYGPCKFFLNGTCKFGDKCLYSHGNTRNANSGQLSRDAVSCQFYAKGFCADGNQCKFVHVNTLIAETFREERELTVCKS